ncbi:hypothetical protein ACFWA5_50865 [Streptomyces mirabilis]|uniref:hypothetical protein n=1 Tax=Streptomyces mirabilis TaxID=68239 RepID=UPI00365697DF
MKAVPASAPLTILPPSSPAERATPLSTPSRSSNCAIRLAEAAPAACNARENDARAATERTIRPSSVLATTAAAASTASINAATPGTHDHGSNAASSAASQIITPMIINLPYWISAAVDFAESPSAFAVSTRSGITADNRSSRSVIASPAGPVALAAAPGITRRNASRISPSSRAASWSSCPSSHRSPSLTFGHSLPTTIFASPANAPGTSMVSTLSRP